jgi:hypothetical protein
METMILGPDGSTNYTHTIAQVVDAMYQERCKRLGYMSIMIDCSTGQSECLAYTSWLDHMDPFASAKAWAFPRVEFTF